MSKLEVHGFPTNLGDIQADGAIFGDYPTNYAEFESNGFLEFNGSARAWMDFNFGVNALQRGASAPDFINLSASSIQVLGFDGVNTLEQVSVAMELNHNWAEGTVLKPHLHWYPVNGDAGSVKWQLEYAIVSLGGVVPASTTIAVVQAAGGVAWTGRLAVFSDITTVGQVIGAQLHARLFWDPTDGDDDYGSDAAVATFGFHVLLDTLGSRQVGTK